MKIAQKALIRNETIRGICWVSLLLLLSYAYLNSNSIENGVLSKRKINEQRLNQRHRNLEQQKFREQPSPGLLHNKHPKMPLFENISLTPGMKENIMQFMSEMKYRQQKAQQNILKEMNKGLDELLVIHSFTKEHIQNTKQHLLEFKNNFRHEFLKKSIPCFEGYNNRPKNGTDLRGLIYIRIPKSSSSTLAGINVRIASSTSSLYKKSLCGVTWYHQTALKFNISHRPKSKSVLWSFLRDPSQRIVSSFFYLELSRQKKTFSNELFIQYARRADMSNYQLKYLHGSPFLPTEIALRDYAYSNNLTRWIIPNLLQDYDFIGLTERFDESLVVMQCLFHLKTTDILYFSSNVASSSASNHVYNWDNALRDLNTQKDVCFQMQPSYNTPLMSKYLNSSEFRIRNAGDLLLYDIVNKSLDRTIDQVIGRHVFDRALKEFLHLKNIAKKICHSRIKPPCRPTDGATQFKESAIDCYIDDLGCGYKCLDTITLERYPI